MSDCVPDSNYKGGLGFHPGASDHCHAAANPQFIWLWFYSVAGMFMYENNQMRSVHYRAPVNVILFRSLPLWIVESKATRFETLFSVKGFEIITKEHTAAGKLVLIYILSLPGQLVSTNYWEFTQNCVFSRPQTQLEETAKRGIRMRPVWSSDMSPETTRILVWAQCISYEHTFLCMCGFVFQCVRAWVCIAL